MSTRSGQMGPYFQLHYIDDWNLFQPGMEALSKLLEKKPGSLEELDGSLKNQVLQNFLGELYRRMRRQKVGEVGDLFNPQASMIFGPKSIISSLKEAVKIGMAENYTYHFATTALFLYRALEKRGLLEEVLSEREERGCLSKVQEFARDLDSREDPKSRAE